MVKFAYVTDLHGNRLHLMKALKKAAGDKAVLIIGGDVSPHEPPLEQRKYLEDVFVPLISEFSDSVQIFVLTGNDDARVNLAVLEGAEKNGLLKLIHNRVYSLGEFHIAGYSFVNPTPFALKDWEKGDFVLVENRGITTLAHEETTTIMDDLVKLASKSDPAKTIYVIHAPPYESNLDRLSNGNHAGSKAVRKFIEQKRPLLTLHGHIHESPAVSGEFFDMIGTTVCVNPGANPFLEDVNVVVFDPEKLEDIGVEGI